MLNRNITENLQAALDDTPVVLLSGPRQSGKSTLAKSLTNSHSFTYITFDDMSAITTAKNNPLAFARSFKSSVIFDEVQYVEELFPAIKQLVDENRCPGRFVLTGSANIMLLPKISESLAGRIEILSLWPFSQGEIIGKKENFIDRIFSKHLAIKPQPTYSENNLISKIVTGGYPEVLQRKSAKRREAWFRSYVDTILKRDIRDVADIQGLADLPRLLQLLASRVSSLINFAEISRSAEIPQTTLKRYMTMLQMVFLVQLIPAWLTNLSKRVIKSPKLILCDTGLVSFLLGANDNRFVMDRQLLGKVLENFVAMELIKQISWSEKHPSIFHFRTQMGQEVDIILEDRAGTIVGIEVKASANLSSKDIKGLKMLQEIVGEKFYRGIVLYDGQNSYQLDDNIIAMPIESLWA
jgi:predicted AAA+ superfamily ATPase